MRRERTRTKAKAETQEDNAQPDDNPGPPEKTSFFVPGPFLVQSSVAVVAIFALGLKSRTIFDDSDQQQVGKDRVPVVGKFFEEEGSNRLRFSSLLSFLLLLQ